ncbi:hypothetical protein [Frigoriglobus tundricola]|uniref:Uncharacterized protein n=1 Tax=Frigoriglobus tundricola TaxID=2774151 RepID=A0A6M5YUM1_9BACT|nr:hypothetical protein [Frigoriglobus tundricola]QJW97096.1 hypothetical protein FTUN_4661 [Frigoriglobus tundricola]
MGTRVADFHTYFVGDEHWGFAAWAHNDYTVQHLPAGNNRNSVYSVDGWNVFAKSPSSGGAKPDRAVLTADGSGLFQFKTKAAAEAIARH